jgi:hypothetical protein
VCDTYSLLDLAPVIVSFGQAPQWNGSVGYFNTALIQAAIQAAMASALAMKAAYLPALTAAQMQTYNNAVALATQDIKNMGSQCDQALGSQGVASLLSVVSSPQVEANVYNGQTSSYPVPGGGTSTYASYFAANANSVGAAVVNFVPPGSGTNIEFLGPAFFNPGLAGVPNGNYAQAQAFMVLHEAVHLVTGLGDAAFGGSNQLTNALVQNCFPILGLPGALGGLTTP